MKVITVLRKYSLASFFCAVLFVALQSFASAADSPPLPLHTVEGYGGVAITGSAYLVNPAEEDHVLGRPSLGLGGVYTPKGRFFGFATLTETIWDRLELGYGFNVLNLHDLPEDIQEQTGVDIDDDRVKLHNINARLSLIKENQFDLPWLPAVTFGVHYKDVENVDEIDENLGGALTSAGIEDTQGIDYTLYASKMLTQFPRPVLLNLGARYSEAAHIGLLGFTGERDLLLEGNLVVFLTDKFLIGAEYRQKPTGTYNAIDGLVEPEDDWWSLTAAYVFNDHFTVSGGLFNFGEVLNHYDNGSIGLKVKYEF